MYWIYHLIISLDTSSVFITHPQNHFIHINEDAVFECVANGSESLTINWNSTSNVKASSRLKISNELQMVEREASSKSRNLE